MADPDVEVHVRQNRALYWRREVGMARAMLERSLPFADAAGEGGRVRAALKALDADRNARSVPWDQPSLFEVAGALDQA